MWEGLGEYHSHLRQAVRRGIFPPTNAPESTHIKTDVVSHPYFWGGLSKYQNAPTSGILLPGLRYTYRTLCLRAERNPGESMSTDIIWPGEVDKPWMRDLSLIFARAYGLGITAHRNRPCPTSLFVGRIVKIPVRSQSLSYLSASQQAF